MGHYDSDYDADEERRLRHYWAHRRADLDAYDAFHRNIAQETPDRFRWAFDDYRRWLAEGVAEWEKSLSFKVLKGE